MIYCHVLCFYIEIHQLPTKITSFPYLSGRTPIIFLFAHAQSIINFRELHTPLISCRKVQSVNMVFQWLYGSKYGV